MDTPENALRVTILYVEDNSDNRMLVRRILQADGYDILEAANATEALEVINTHQPDLILMDINMPDVDGYTFTKQLRNTGRFQNTPIVALTANVMKGDQEKSLAAGCNGYIQKPIDVDSFSDNIRKYLFEGSKEE